MADATKTAFLATYIVERCQQEYRMLAHAPSKLAAAGVNMALRTLSGSDAWNPTLTHFSGYSEEQLGGVIRDAEAVLEAGAASSLQAVRKKYGQAKYMEVAAMPLARLAL